MIAPQLWRMPENGRFQEIRNTTISTAWEGIALILLRNAFLRARLRKT